MAFATVNGTELFYVESGRGIPFFAIHGGLGFDHAYLRNAFAPVEDLARIVYFDQRCNGRSKCSSIEELTMEQLAADVDGLRQELGFEKVGLAGHSYGGFVALQYAVTYPDHLSHLILLDTSPGTFEPTDAELAERGDRSWVTAEHEAAMAAIYGELPATDEEFRALAPAIARVWSRGDTGPALAEANRAILKVDAARRGFEILGGWSVDERLGEIGCPTLVACGRHDLLTTPECSKRLADKIPNAELTFFENSGHMPWLEEPQAFNDRMRDFLVDHW